MFVCSLLGLEMELQGMLILIMLEISRSFTRYVFTIGGCAISWKATLQSTVALSTIEAEYMAVIKACKEALWLKGFFGELCD